MSVHLVGVASPPAWMVTSAGRRATLIWPDDWPVPREGETIELPDLRPLAVRRVVWYPAGDPENGDEAPFVHVVIG